MNSRVGIFSRSSETDYMWLLKGLGKDFKVQPFCITNSNYFQFRQEVGKCRFAILYHTKNRGRINITDVTDSLYDREIADLHEEHGKDRVIAVVDDLEDSSFVTKNRILEHQHRLKRMTKDVFLFTGQEKADRETLRRKLEVIRDLIRKGVKQDQTIRIDEAKNEHPRDGIQKERRSNFSWYQMPLLAPTLAVFWMTYYTPNKRHGVLSILWAAVLVRYLSSTRSSLLLPFNFMVRSTICYSLTLLSAYNTYSLRSLPYFVPTGLWCATSRNYFSRRYRRQAPSNGFLKWVFRYAVVYFTFWNAFNTPASSEVLGEIPRLILQSPGILAAEIF